MKWDDLTENSESARNECLWVDDERPVPGPEWDLARTYQEAVDKLSQHNYRTVSLDHDLGDWQSEREMTGYDVLLWLVQKKMDGQPVPDHFRVHTANPAARPRMVGVIQRYLMPD